MGWKDKQFDWNFARAFMMVADQGSLSAAARVMGVSQPTLGRQISSFEASLNLTLFERMGKGLVLTRSGQRLYQNVKAMAQAAEQFSLVAYGQSNDVEGDVCVSLSQLDAYFRFPPLWPKFREYAPKIRLELDVSNQISDLKSRESDVAIRYQRPEEEDLIIKKLGTEAVYLYGHKDYVASFEDKLPHQVPNLQLIGFDQSDQMIDYLNSLGWQIGKQHFSFLCDNQLVQWQMVQQGNALAFLPDHIAAKQADLIPAFSTYYKPIELDVWLVCHRELHTNPRVRLVFDFLAEHFSCY